MNRILAWICVVLCLSACAQDEIENAEQRARLDAPELNFRSLRQYRTLRALGAYAERTALAYSDAANNIQRNQDLASLLVIGAAGAAVSWAVEGVSTEAIGQVAAGGVTAEIAGRRYAPRQVIRGVLIGAKRMNCVAFHTNVLAARKGEGTVPGAVEATRAAIHQVQFKTRESLVREQEGFEAIFDKFKEQVNPAGFAVPTERDELEEHIRKLQACAEDGDDEAEEEDP